MLCADHWPWVRGGGGVGWGARPLACSRSQRSFACDTWLTEGAGDRLVRGDVLAPAPGPAPAAAAQPPQTACGEPARAGQWQARDAQEHTFYLPKLGGQFQQFSLLSDRASGRPKFRLQGRPGTDSRDVRGEKKPTLERKITGRRVPPRRLLVTLLWEGLGAPGTTGLPRMAGPSAAH